MPELVNVTCSSCREQRSVGEARADSDYTCRRCVQDPRYALLARAKRLRDDLWEITRDAEDGQNNLIGARNMVDRAVDLAAPVIDPDVEGTRDA